MKKTNYIKQILAAFFLLLFSFCVTPKRFLHDILANHQDTQNTAGILPGQIASSGFHCHIDDLVVVAPYLPELPFAASILISSVSVHFSEEKFSPVHLFLLHGESRGPPASLFA